MLISPDSLCIQRFDPSLGLIASPINPILTTIGLAPPPALAPPPCGPPDLPVVKEIIHSQSCTLFPQNPSKTLNMLVMMLIKMEVVVLLLLLYRL